MPTRKEVIAPGEYYHVLARGVNKQRLFFDNRDYTRFIFYILFFQAPRRIFNISKHITNFLNKDDFKIPQSIVDEILKERKVDLVAFALMGNHIHLLLGEITKGGISKMMQRTLNGYSKYFHLKYKKSGHIFEGPFKAVRIKNNKQLLYLSTYIHKNPKEANDAKSRWESYTWSSYQDYVEENRWEKLLSRNIILKQFRNPREYMQFTRESAAKELKVLLDRKLLMD